MTKDPASGPADGGITRPEKTNGRRRHTPPPWDWDEESGEIESSSGGAICSLAHHGNVNTIARTGEYYSHANARLIAASPRLLGALRDIADHFDCDESAHRHDATCRKCLAMEMVRLATGDE